MIDNEEKEKPHPDLTEWEGSYHITCDCGRCNTIFSQRESPDCEYTQDVWVECTNCKRLVHFSVSVN